MRLRELHVHAKEIRLFQNPFAADIDEALPCYQFESAELQNCDVLKDAFKPNGFIEFYAALPNNIPKHQKACNEEVHTFWQRVYLWANLFIHETDENSDEIKTHWCTFASDFETGCDIGHLTT